MRTDAQLISRRWGRVAFIGSIGLGFALGPSACSDDSDDGGGSAGTAMATAGSGGSSGSGMGGGAGSSMGGTAMALGGGGMGGTGMTAAVTPDAMSNGLELPADVFDWRVLGMVKRSDGGIRVVVGNDTAIDAWRSGQWTPSWPDGTMIADLAWQDGENSAIANSVTPADFNLVALMEKDSTEFAESGGWRYGAWRGMELAPVDSDQGCIDCHTAEVADNDFVFTRVGPTPSVATVQGASAGPNGVELPDGFLNWRVIGVVDRSDDNDTVRVVIGNDRAVEAARAGNTDPWPNGSMIGDIVWNEGDNDAAFNDTVDGSVVPGTFASLILMVRDDTAYADDGGWAYGQWTGTNLDPREEGFDAACIDCHTTNVSDNDFVFTVPAAFPNF